MTPVEVCSPITLVRLIFFLNFIEDNNLFDLQISGFNYTWCNNQSGSARQWARLDCCLVNSVWQDKYHSYSLKLLPRIFSDHTPLLLAIHLISFISRKIFHFETYWLDYIGCINAIKEACNFSPHGNPMHSLSHLFAHT